MEGLVLYNCLDEIIRTINKIHSNVRIVYAGNGRYIPLLNEALKKYNAEKYIDCYIDFNQENWDKEIADVFTSKYYERIMPLSSRHPVLVKSPYEVISSRGKKAFIVQSIDGEEVRKNLIKAGVNYDDIYVFSKGSREMLHESNLAADLIKGKRGLTLLEMQKVELNILIEFHNFCKRNGLTYYLSSGSLLGAVRHKGFIPWDDDIDVYMPYEDYIRFMESYPSGGRYEAVCWEKYDNYFLTFGKLCDTETLLLHPGFPVCGCMGVYIDIFPLAAYPDDEDRNAFWEENPRLEMEWMDYYAARTLLGTDILDIRNKIIQKRYPLKITGADYVGARHYLSYVKPWCVRKEIYASTVCVEFEGVYFDAPVGWDELLKIRYGNYMKIPPKEKQVTHMFEAYIRE